MVSKKTPAAVTPSFPSSLERTVASALLLLSSPSPKEETETYSPPQEITHAGWKLVPFAKSVAGSDTSPSGDSSVSVAAASVPWFSDLKLKIVRKKRSKTVWISDEKRRTQIKPKPAIAPASSDCSSEITTADTLSSLSCSSRQGSCNQNNAADKKRKAVISGHMWNQAEAILQILSNGSASEVRIRELLGDNPTTSKALRILLKQEMVKRYGAGGRGNPYIYTMAE